MEYPKPVKASTMDTEAGPKLPMAIKAADKTEKAEGFAGVQGGQQRGCQKPAYRDSGKMDGQIHGTFHYRNMPGFLQKSTIHVATPISAAT